ncbi:hypothetical protein SEA_DMITRI_24 [Gordonia phage Dmitri]|nr:hypothetical protein SEA_DMITRI_24 [Gordonia phage Dmitri]
MITANAWMNPSALSDIGVVGVVVGMALALGLGLMRGWIVPGTHHKEMLAEKDAQLARADARSIEDAKAISTLSQAIVEKNAVEQASAHLLQSIRESVKDGA